MPTIEVIASHVAADMKMFTQEDTASHDVGHMKECYGETEMPSQEHTASHGAVHILRL